MTFLDTNSGAKLDQAANSDILAYIAEIMRIADLRTAEDLAQFMSEVLLQSGVRAGNATELANWREAVERSKTEAQFRSTERINLYNRIQDLEEEVARLKASNEPGSTDKAKDTLMSLLNGSKEETRADLDDAGVFNPDDDLGADGFVIVG